MFSSRRSFASQLDPPAFPSFRRLRLQAAADILPTLLFRHAISLVSRLSILHFHLPPPSPRADADYCRHAPRGQQSVYQ